MSDEEGLSGGPLRWDPEARWDEQLERLLSEDSLSPTELLRSLPKALGDLQLLDYLGEGGMGIVYLARPVSGWLAEQTREDVALKLLRPAVVRSPELMKRQLRLTQLGARLRHPSVVQTWGILDAPWPGVIMQSLRGSGLDQHIRAQGMHLDEALSILGPLGEAIDYLHAQDVVHRDLKPENIQIDPDGRPVILDLGVALDRGRPLDESLQGPLGTSRWMAPEQADMAEVTGAADRYAFGLIAYALLSGSLPWESGCSDYRMMSNKMTGALVPLSHHRGDLGAQPAEGVMALLAPRPADRPASCAAALQSLRSRRSPPPGSTAPRRESPAPPASGETPSSRSPGSTSPSSAPEADQQLSSEAPPPLAPPRPRAAAAPSRPGSARDRRRALEGLRESLSPRWSGVSPAVYYFAPHLPRQRLEILSQRCRLPRREPVLLMVDWSPLPTERGCLLLTARALYGLDLERSAPADRWRLSMGPFLSQPLLRSGPSTILLAGEQPLHHPPSLMKLETFLRELWALLRGESLSC